MHAYRGRAGRCRDRRWVVAVVARTRMLGHRRRTLLMVLDEVAGADILMMSGVQEEFGLWLDVSMATVLVSANVWHRW